MQTNNPSYLAFANSNIDFPVDTIIVADQSGSMSSQDFQPSRLEGLKQAVKALIDEKRANRPEDRVCLVGFSDRANVIANYKSVDNEYTHLVEPVRFFKATGRTDFGKALQLSEKMLQQKNQNNNGSGNSGNSGALSAISSWFGKANHLERKNHMIFLSDGGHNGVIAPFPIVERMKELYNLHVDTIGIGGSPLDVDEELLKNIASSNEHGEPSYRFIGDTTALVERFKKMATLQVY